MEPSLKVFGKLGIVTFPPERRARALFCPNVSSRTSQVFPLNKKKQCHFIVALFLIYFVIFMIFPTFSVDEE